jgi:hypothetical protein
MFNFHDVGIKIQELDYSNHFANQINPLFAHVYSQKINIQKT